MNKDDLKEYLGQMVRVELVRHSGHTVHTGIMKSCNGNYLEILTPRGRTIWIKKPIKLKDKIEVMEYENLSKM